MNDSLNALVRRHKSALTRAKKKGPEEVIRAAETALEDFDNKGIWPDNWSLWQRAKDDAILEIRYR